MPPRRASSSGAQSGGADAAAAPILVDRLGKVRPPNSSRGSLEVAELLPFQRNLLQQLVPPEDGMPNTNDAMVIMARGLGLRTVVTSFVSRTRVGDALSRINQTLNVRLPATAQDL